MQYRNFGRHGFKVSEVGHGLWGMGGWSGSEDKQSMQALQRSLDLGCNFYDTALAYGEGHSEKLLGKLIGNNPGKEIIVATKVPPKNRIWPGSSADKLKDTFPASYIVDSTKRSLKNLGVDRIDLQQLHVWDDSWTKTPNGRKLPRS